MVLCLSIDYMNVRGNPNEALLNQEKVLVLAKKKQLTPVMFISKFKERRQNCL